MENRRTRREAVVRRHMEAENVHDFDAVIDTFDHPRYELVATGQVHDGEEEVRAYFAATRSAFPDQRNELVAMHSTEDGVWVEFDLLGTHEGEFLGIPATGRRATIRVMDFVRYRDGRIAEHWNVVDVAGLVAQLGVAAA